MEQVYNQITNEELLRIIADAPGARAVYSTGQFVIVTANRAMSAVWGVPALKPGQTLEQVAAQLPVNPQYLLLQQAYRTGKPYTAKNIKTEVEGHPIPRYFDICYQPIKNESGEVHSILHTATDVTELNDCLRDHEHVYRDKANSMEKNLLSLVMHAHYGLVILRGSDFIIEIANSEMANIWDKQLADITGRPLLEVLPEFNDQPFPVLLKQVFMTGIGHGQDEAVCYIETPLGRKTKCVSFYYDPLFDEAGAVSGIIVSVANVSDKVHNRQLLVKSYEEQRDLINKLALKNQELQKSEEMLRMSIEAAKVGTWFINVKTLEFTMSPRQRVLFGFHTEDKVSIADLMNQISPEYRGRAQAEFTKVVTIGGLYNTEAPVLGYHDQKTRWVKSSGSVIADEEGTFTYFSGVSIETTEQKQDELRKDHFINIVSHELKTPLTSLKGYIQLLQHKAESVGDEYMSVNLARADSKLDKMTSLINGFLNVHQLESGKIKLTVEQFDLNALIKEVADETNMRRKNTYVAFIANSTAFVKADREKIGQVLVNLLDNANKYSHPSGKIEVYCSENEGQITVSIHDNGIGISMDSQRRIFERYYRVENQDSNFVSGFGIGLYLCHEIVSRHDGKIWVESVEGEGSTFSFSLAAA